MTMNSNPNVPVPGDTTGDGKEAHLAAMREGIDEAQAATVRAVNPVTEVYPDADDGLDKTGGRVTTIRQLTFTGTYPSIASALDAVKGKAMGFREANPDLRIETATQPDGQVALSALMTFTIVVDDE